MTAQAEHGTEPAFYEQTWDLSYRHALGETTSRFLAGLAKGEIWGRRDPASDRVLVPPRSYSDRDHTPTTDWVKVANEGVIEMFTVVYEPFRNLPDPPYALAYVTLDGADTALVGYVKGVDLKDREEAVRRLAIGERVVVAFADEPTGTAADYWFEPAGD